MSLRTLAVALSSAALVFSLGACDDGPGATSATVPGGSVGSGGAEGEAGGEGGGGVEDGADVKDPGSAGGADESDGGSAGTTDPGGNGETDPEGEPDGTGGEPDPTGEPDAGPEGQPDTDPEPEGGGDPCDPNPCTTPPADTCIDGEVVTYAADGACADSGGAAACTYEGSASACAMGLKCWQGECIEGGGEIGDYPFSGDASVINALGLADTSCCFDFDGDGSNDNGVMSLLNSFLPLIGQDLDVQGMIDEAIEGGDISILFEQIGLDDATNDASLSIAGFAGYDEDEDYSDNLAGTGSFLVQPLSFDPVSGQPLIHFAEAAIAGGVLEAGPGDFAIATELQGQPINVVVKNTMMEADSSEGTSGSGLDLDDGIMGGVIPMAQIVDLGNDFLGNCTCFGTGGADVFQLAGEDSLKCTSSFQTSSPSCIDGVDESACVTLAEYKGLLCSIGVGLIKPDIDTDLSGKPDAFSIGLTFAAVSAEVVGVGDDVSGGCDSGGCVGGGGDPLNTAVHLGLFGLLMAWALRRRSS